jgi:hypothetical protein
MCTKTSRHKKKSVLKYLSKHLRGMRAALQFHKKAASMAHPACTSLKSARKTGLPLSPSQVSAKRQNSF